MPVEVGTEGRLGADAAALDALAAAFREGEALLAAARWSRPSAPAWWDGPDADAVMGVLASVAAERRRAATVLERCAVQLRRAAREQRAASASSPPVAVRVDLPGGGGRLIQRVGAASASIVVVLVPGAGTDRDDRERLRRDAATVWSALSAVVDDARSIAVVSWLGYDPPDVVVQGLDTGPAERGAAALVGEVDALRRAGARRVVVVGHSYGGLVVGRAALDGMAADAVVQLGSPGVGAPGAVRAIEAAGVELVAVRAEGDPIGAIAGRLPGRFGEDAVGRTATLPTSRAGHSAYLTDDVLLDALARLAVGSPGGR